MRKDHILRKLAFVLPMVIFGYGVNAQVSPDESLPECDTIVPFFPLDMTGDPDSIYTTPQVTRIGECCSESGSGNQTYISFYAELHPDAVMVEIGIATGADPGGSGNYNQILGGDLDLAGICQPDIDGGEPVCLQGASPYKFVYHKPGGNDVAYYFKQVPRPIFPEDQGTRFGCSLPLDIYGLNNITIQAIATTGTASLPTCDSYMNKTDPAHPIFTPGSNATYPYTISYRICGVPQAAACGTYSPCDTVVLTVYPPLSVTLPAAEYICSSGADAEVVALPYGGDANYSFLWVDENLSNPSLTNTLTTNQAGSYTVYVSDGLTTPTCPAAEATTTIYVADPTFADAGPDQEVCASEGTVQLAGVFDSNSDGHYWTGGQGTFSDSTNALATYTPSALELSTGADVILTFTAEGKGACSNHSDQVTISISKPIIISGSSTDIVCYGGTSDIDATVSGGRPVYNYSWTNGETTEDVTVSAGTYILTVTDSYSCSESEIFTVTEPSPIVLNMSNTDETLATCDGSVSVAISGGDGPYSIVWKDALNNTIGTDVTTVSALCDGVYTVTVTDANGCVVSSSTVVNTFACNGFDITVGQTDVDCYGNSTGSATVTGIIGGVGPGYSYTWSNGGSTASITNLSAGVYTVTVADLGTSPNCIEVASIQVFQPTAITNTMTSTDLTSANPPSNDGTATANPQGGTPGPGYSYSWNPGGQTTQTATSLSVGLYTVLITDNNTCTFTDQVFINQPPCSDFLIAVNHTDVSCNGENDGSAYLFIANGSGPYDIEWSAGPAYDDMDSISGLTAGVYTVTVTDDAGCFSIKNFTITEPSALQLGLAQTNITCYGLENGTIDLTVSGGTFPYNYTWTETTTQGTKPYSNSQDIISLGAHTYTVTVTDINGCTETASIGIQEPAEIVASFTWVNNPCFNQNVGSINTTASGGISPYDFSWTGPNGFTSPNEDISGLYAGMYKLTVTDQNNCSNLIPFEVYISQPALLVTTAAMTAEVTCNGGNDGTASSSVTGGKTPYTYAWSGPNGYTSSDANPTGMEAGTYTLTVTDANLCTATTTVSITTVTDVTDPTITCPAPVIVNADPGLCTASAVDLGTPVAADNCLVASVTNDAPAAFPLGTTTVTWTVEDGAGNTASCTHTVTVIDNQNPTITCPPTVNVFADGGLCSASGVNLGTPTAADNCTSVTVTNNAPATFPLGTTTVTWTVTDGAGRTASCNQLVIVADNQIPTITCPAPVGVNTNPNSCIASGVNLGTPTTSDNCVSVTVNNNAPAIYPIGVTNVTWTVTDGSSNTATCIQTVTVTDAQDPTIVCPSTVTVNADLGVCTAGSVNLGTPAVADNCVSTTVSNDAPGTFPLGTTTVTWTVTDGSSNTASCTQNVIVLDNQNPTITCPPTVNVFADAGQCTASGVTLGTPTAADNCTSVTVTNNAPAIFPLGTTTVTWTVTDGAGRTATCNQLVIVADNQNPTIICPAPVAVNTDPNSCAATNVSLGTPTTSDNCTAVTVTNNAPPSFPIGITTVTWIVTDGSSNSVSCSQTVTVTDIQNPQIICPSTVTVNADPGVCTAGTVNLGTPATSDNCTVGSVTNNAPNPFPLGTTTVIWTVTDGSGNSATCPQTVIVNDNQDPTITCNGPVSVSADLGACTTDLANVSLGTPTTNDNCSVATVVNNAPAAFPIGTTIVTWTVTDGSSNDATCTQTVTVTDDQDPIISNCPSNITVGSDAGDCGAIVDWDVPTYTDNCGAVMTFTHDPGVNGIFFPVGTTTVTYTVTDGSTNVSICSFTVTVNDTEAPAITCPAQIETCVPLVSYNTPVASDNCGININGVSQTAGLPSGATFAVGTTMNVFSVTDVNGNVSTCSFNVVVFPVPVITLDPTDVTCNGLNNGAIDATLSVGTDPYTYDWSNNAITEDVTGLAPGTYTLDVIDDNGCTATASASIAEPEVLTLEAEDTHVSCYNAADGAVDITVEGGNLPYTFDWSNNTNDEDVTGLSGGAIDVTVTDAKGCLVTYATAIEEPDTLMLSAVTYAANCGSATGSVILTVTGGTNPYDFAWSDGSDGVNLYNVVSGDYNVTVTDAHGCQNTLAATIMAVNQLEAQLIVRDAKCWGENSGEIQAIVENGYAPFTYDWSDGQSTPTATELVAAAYSVTITDSYGCEVTLTTDVNQPDSLYIELTSSVYAGGYGVSSYNGADGYVNADVYGGISPYEYSWLGPNLFESTDQNIAGLSSGGYTLTVIDANGCKATASTRITEPDVLEMPNGFSPNGDGDNDFFDIHGIDAYPDNDLVIYNRWGNIVYDVEGYQNEWNGDNNMGEALPDGTYFAILNVYANGEKVATLTGYVDLRR